MALWNKIRRLLTGQEAVKREESPAMEPDREAVVAVAEAPAAAKPPEVSDNVPWYAPRGATATQPQPVVRPDLSFEGRVLENMLLNQFDGHDVSLPPLPRVPDLVLKKLRDPRCNFTAIAHILSEDQVVAASVLRAANSALYGGVSKITNLSQAVTRLGINPVRTLMMHQSLRAAMFLSAKGNQELAQLYWRRSLAGAFIMRGLSRFIGLDGDDALVMGLLHDVGNVMVLRIVSEDTFGMTLPGYADLEYLCYETHQEFGELVAQAWNMSPSLTALIQNHHTYPAADAPLRVPRLALILTDMMAQMLGYAPPASYALLNSSPVQDLGLNAREDFIRFLLDLPWDIEEAIHLA